MGISPALGNILSPRVNFILNAILLNLKKSLIHVYSIEEHLKNPNFQA